MATPNVAHAASNASSAKAKRQSGFWRSLFTAPEPDDSQDAEPFLPDEPTAEVLRETRKLSALPTAAAPKPQVLYRERPNDIDRAGYNIIGVLTLAGRDKWSAGRILQELDEHWSVLQRIKAQEDAEGQKLLARSSAAAAAPTTALNGIRSVVTAAEMANGLPGVTVTAVIDTKAIAGELTAVTANASALADETMTFEAITADMPDPRVTVSIGAVPATTSSSPVHVPGESLRPPVPDGEDANPGERALPQRIPHLTVIAAPVNPDGSPKHGERVDPAEPSARLGSGDWVFRGATDAHDGPVWRQVATVKAGEGGTVISYRSGDPQTVKRGNTVRVLSDSEAAYLLAQYQAAGVGNGQVTS